MANRETLRSKALLIINGIEHVVPEELTWCKALPRSEWDDENEELIAIMEDTKEINRLPRKFIETARRQFYDMYPVLKAGDPDHQFNRVVELHELEQYLKDMGFVEEEEEEEKRKEEFYDEDEEDEDEDDEDDDEDDDEEDDDDGDEEDDEEDDEEAENLCSNCATLIQRPRQ